VTALTTREPARTNPRDAQSAGSRQLPAAVLAAVSTVALAAVAVAAGFLTSNDYVTCGFMTLSLTPFLTGPSRGREGGKR
jgi:hypothetical protein